MARPRTGKDFSCKECEKNFYVSVSGQKRNRTNFCSLKCSGMAHRGKNSPSWKRGYFLNEKGYKRIIKNGKYVYEHRYLMEQHIGRKLLNTETIHHKDGDKLNNSIGNLQILFRSEHIKIHGRVGIKNNKSKLNNEQVLMIRKLYQQGEKTNILAKIYNVDVSNIRYILNRITWKHI